MKRVVVTGASGFIGRALVERLIGGRFEVVAVSRRGVDKPAIEDVRVAAYDNPGELARILDGASTVIHLAARAHQFKEAIAGARERYYEANVASTLSLLRASKIVGVRRFILMSSIGVNGNCTLGTPFTENDQPAPVELYAVSKLAAEQLLASELNGSNEIDYVVIRPPLVYGPNAPGNFGRLMNAVAHGIPLPLGAIHNQRSLVGLDNLVDLIVACLNHPAAANQTFLVSDGEDLSTTQLLQRMAHALGRPARLLPVPAWVLEAGAAMLGKRALSQRLCGSLQVDISKTRDLLGWTPPISVDEGLRRTARHFLA